MVWSLKEAERFATNGNGDWLVLHERLLARCRVRNNVCRSLTLLKFPFRPRYLFCTYPSTLWLFSLQFDYCDHNSNIYRD